MKRLRNIKFTPSMVVASLALLVALSGTGVAAVAIVTPSANTVGTLQLKTAAVTSVKVRNGSLLKADFKAGQILNGAPGPAGAQGPTGATGAAGAAGVAGVAAPGYVAGVVSTSSTSTSTVTSSDYADLASSSVNVTVPAGETDSLVVWFSGQSTCSGGSATAHCLVRILVDGNELAPASGNDSVFDSNALRGTFNANVSGGKDGVAPDTGSNNVGGKCPSGDPCTAAVDYIKGSQAEEARSIIRLSSTNLTAGVHVVKVQTASTSTATDFKLRNWTLVVQRIKVS